MKRRLVYSGGIVKGDFFVSLVIQVFNYSNMAGEERVNKKGTIQEKRPDWPISDYRPRNEF